ncbi:uncharacterized protein GGS25DRAFT_521748 [Hypoxylon fragiforme]|uniref:uncharacterized protein n=1 Tax=Hypoxylon fragiforme TaxID=63214 RepID=UPI0020C6D855|nr:uncharacterized protein GGS25DRAFT_521748 [Hypoxylon fragiforme]KAI2608575.1 hypothetical protein GGS25DRAFT_521748 [Hypoxylon fragiforme]
MALPIFTKRQDDSGSDGGESMELSAGAIAGIAVGGAAILFVALAWVLVKASRRNSYNRQESTHPEMSMETGTAEGGPNRLRKKSLVGEQMAAIIDKEDDVGREESRSRHSSINVPSPIRTRQGSMSRTSITADGTGRGSTDTQSQTQKQRSPEKQRGYGLYQHRRKTSWIDEDALHGPTMTSPEKTKQKHKRKMSWFDGGLGRSLSRLSTRSGMGEVSPTLPYTETESDRQQVDTHAESAGERSTMRISQTTQISSHTITPHTSLQPQQLHQQQQAYTSPQKAQRPVSNVSPSKGNMGKSPPDIIQNPRFRDRVSFQAAQQLAGGARVPAVLSVPHQPPQAPLPQPMPPTSTIRQAPILKHSATDTELTEILRMTAERLQDGHRSSRRQTMMVPYSSTSLLDQNGQLYFDGGNVSPGSELPSSGTISPVKSHKSAPATLAYIELEGSNPKPQGPRGMVQTPRHSRHISHMSQISQVSMISEADSLVASKRESVQEVRTALSSPSRVARSAEPTPSPQGPRPFSNGSTMSSALSTLYSMEEASVRSQPHGSSNANSSPAGTPRREKKPSAFDMFNGNPDPENRDGKSPKFRFEQGDRPPPLRLRRGTMGMVAHDSLPSSMLSPRQDMDPNRSTKHKSSYIVPPSYPIDDPFTIQTPPKNPARLSKVFSPLPVDYSGGGGSPNRRNAFVTPTPSPTRTVVPPSPRTIINMHRRSSSGRTPTSPVVSEAGLSSVYDSYRYSHGEAPNETATDSTVSLTTVLTSSSDASPTKQVLSHTPSSGRESRVGFRVPNYSQPSVNDQDAKAKHYDIGPTARVPQTPGQPEPRRGMPSDGSIYSQDEDSVPPLRTPTVKRGKSVRMSNTISELRRMNSQISTASDLSVASSTVPVMRGGGSSPGWQSGGGKNYLSLGGGLRNSGRSTSSKGNRVSFASDTSTSPKPNGFIRRGTPGRGRRGTVVLQGSEARRQELDRVRESPRRGDNDARVNVVKHAGQLLTQATKLRREEITIKRGSVESLYDDKGFLKSQL